MSKAEADKANTGLNIVPHILREANSVTVLFFLCIHIGLRINACLANKTQSTEEAICIFPHLA